MDHCPECPAGYKGPLLNLSSCQACNGGQFTARPGEQGCQNCAAGKRTSSFAPIVWYVFLCRERIIFIRSESCFNVCLTHFFLLCTFFSFQWRLPRRTKRRRCAIHFLFHLSQWLHCTQSIDGELFALPGWMGE